MSKKFMENSYCILMPEIYNDNAFGRYRISTSPHKRKGIVDIARTKIAYLISRMPLCCSFDTDQIVSGVNTS